MKIRIIEVLLYFTLGTLTSSLVHEGYNFSNKMITRIAYSQRLISFIPMKMCVPEIRLKFNDITVHLSQLCTFYNIAEEC